MLETKKWEMNVQSKITNQDPTDIIIKEIGEYEIYIGIMWHRFGSSTIQRESGTEQEFRTALKYYKEYKKPLIKFYFSERKFRLEDEEMVLSTI
jgi:adenylate kinase family enzyme